MKVFLLVAVSLLVVSCATTDLPEIASENQANITKLSLGMSKAAVVQLMGNRIAHTPDGPVNNPFRTETFQSSAGVNFEILYYVTERHRRFQPVRLRQTTPLVFKDGVLTGWGSDALKQATGQDLWRRR